MMKLLRERQSISPEVKSNDFSNCSYNNFTYPNEWTETDRVCGKTLIRDIFGVYSMLLKDCDYYVYPLPVDEVDTIVTYCSSCCSAVKGHEICLNETDSKLYGNGTTSDTIVKSILNSDSNDASEVINKFFLSNDRAEYYSLPKNEFIISCTFNEMQCSPSDFEEWMNERYGRCYTFNSFFATDDLEGTNTKGNVKKARTDGPKSGLKLILNIKAADALSLYSPESGVRVVVHSPKTIPFPEEEGFNVQTEASTDVQLKMKKYERVPPPHGTCRNIKVESKYSYSQMLCRKICLEKYLQENCGCRTGQGPAYDQIVYEGPTPSCRDNPIQLNPCFEIAQVKFTHRLLECDCPIPCEEDDYDVMISSSKIDNSHYKIIQNIKEKIIEDDLSKGSTNSTVRLKVYLKKLMHELIKESPSYSFDTLICNLGGNLGLFVGMSIVSIVELVVFIVDLIYESIKRQTQVEEKKKQENQDKFMRVYVIPQSQDKGMNEFHRNTKTAWSEGKKEKPRDYFSKIFFEE